MIVMWKALDLDRFEGTFNNRKLVLIHTMADGKPKWFLEVDGKTRRKTYTSSKEGKDDVERAASNVVAELTAANPTAQQRKSTPSGLRGKPIFDRHTKAVHAVA